MSILLLLVGFVTGLVCVVKTWSLLEALAGLDVADNAARQAAGLPLNPPVTQVDVLVLGVYLVVTVVCFAGVGIITAIRGNQPKPVSAESRAESAPRKISQLDVGWPFTASGSSRADAPPASRRSG